MKGSPPTASDEELRELRLELARARQREKELRAQSNALLTAMQQIADTRTGSVVLMPLLRLLCDRVGGQLGVALMRRHDGFEAVEASAPELVGVPLALAALLRAPFEQGQVVNVFSLPTRSQLHELGKALDVNLRAALLCPVRTDRTELLVACLHAARAGYGPREADFAERFLPALNQSVVSWEARIDRQERDRISVEARFERQRVALLEEATSLMEIGFATWSREELVDDISPILTSMISAWPSPVDWWDAVRARHPALMGRSLLEVTTETLAPAEVTLTDPYGAERSFVVALTRPTSPASTDARMVILVRDRTATRQREDALRASEEKFHNLFHFSNDAIVVLGGDHGIVDLNRRAEGQLGAGRRKLISRSIDSFVHPSELETFRARVDSALAGERWHIRTRFRTADKVGFIADVSLSPVSGSGRRLAQATIRDVTSEVEQSQQLAMLSVVASKTDNGVVITDAHGRIDWVNKAFERLTGYTLAEIRGSTPGAFLQGPGTDAATRALIRDHLRRAEPVEAEILNYRKDGSAYWVALNIAPVRDARGRLKRFVAIEADVTERRNFQDMLIRARDAAEAANRAKQDFLATMSHEIRTPLNAIIGMSDLIMDSPLTAMQRDLLRSVQSNSESLLALINDILDFSKIEAGEMDIESSAFDVLDVCESALEAIVVRAAGNDLDVVADLDATMPTEFVGDATRLKQVLVNLLGNAVKFTSDGFILLRALHDPRRGYLRFDVLDTGIGIRASDQSRVLEKFRQADGSTTRRAGGTGLGLTISSELVELMGGTLSLKSEPDKGSVFTVKLPVTDETLTGTRAQQTVETHDDRGWLVVTDNPFRGPAVVRNLQSLGIDARSCSSASWIRDEIPTGFGGLVIDDAIDAYVLERIVEGVEQSVPAEVGIVWLVTLGRAEPDVLGERERVAVLPKPVRRRAFRACISELYGQRAMETSNLGVQPASVTREERIHVLLAEDSPDSRKYMEVAIGRMQVELTTARDGAEAVAAAALAHFDLILMDLEMPEMDGLEATRRIRAIEEREYRANAPIVALTAHAVEGYREACLVAGMSEFATKPIRRERLEQLVRESADRRPVVLALTAEPKREAAIRQACGDTMRVIVVRDTEAAATTLDRSRVSILLVDQTSVDTRASKHLVGSLRRRPSARRIPLLALSNERRSNGAASGGIEFDAYIALPVRVETLRTRLEEGLSGSVRHSSMEVAAVPRPTEAPVRLRTPLENQRASARRDEATGMAPTVPGGEHADGAGLGMNELAWLEAAFGTGPVERSAVRPVIIEDDMLELATEYLADRRKQIPQLEGLVRSGGLEELRGLAHQIKGSGTMYGFPEITRIGAELQTAAEAGDAKTSAGLVAELAHYVAAVRVQTKDPGSSSIGPWARLQK